MSNSGNLFGYGDRSQKRSRHHALRIGQVYKTESLACVPRVRKLNGLFTQTAEDHDRKQNEWKIIFGMSADKFLAQFNDKLFTLTHFTASWGDRDLAVLEICVTLIYQ